MPNRFRKRKHGPRTRASAAPPVTVDVTQIGARGDGIAVGPNGPLYIPFSVPGDRVTVRPGVKRGDGYAAEILSFDTESPDRATPACRHYTRCGGCSLQHLDPALYRTIKQNLLSDALSRKGFDTGYIQPAQAVGPGTRRRLRLSAVRLKNRTVLGFNERAGSEVIDLGECPVARRELSALFQPLRELAGALESLGRGGDFQITLTDSGPDLLIIPAKGADPTLSDRRLCTEFAEDHTLARIAWQTDGFDEPVAARHPAIVRFAGTPVSLPIGAFLQPSEEGERILTDLVLSGLPDMKIRIADLFAGCGTFSLPLADAGANVQAFEIAEDAVAALRKAAAGKRIQAQSRDLEDNPLRTDELNAFDAVVFDPPRAGAATQAQQIADSDVPTVIAVSCNPSTLARDLAILAEGGYRLERVTPVDQFTWSAHLEAVAILRR